MILALAIPLAVCCYLILVFALCMCILLPLSFIFICTFAEDLGAIKSEFVNQAIMLCISYIPHTKYPYIARHEGIWGKGILLQKRFLLSLEGYLSRVSQAGSY